jgi:hypothetical protein
MKGKPWFAALGVPYDVFAWVGAVRLAKPGSWWDRHRYDAEQHRAAHARFDDRTKRVKYQMKNYIRGTV